LGFLLKNTWRRKRTLLISSRLWHQQRPRHQHQQHQTCPTKSSPSIIIKDFTISQICAIWPITRWIFRRSVPTFARNFNWPKPTMPCWPHLSNTLTNRANRWCPGAKEIPCRICAVVKENPVYPVLCEVPLLRRLVLESLVKLSTAHI